MLLKFAMASLIEPMQLHFILIPLYCPSMSTPLTELGIILANRGVNVTIITNHGNFVRYKSSIDLANIASNVNIRLLSLDPPDGRVAETLVSQRPNDMMRQVLEKLMQELVPSPSCIISSGTDEFCNEIAWKLKIPFYVFSARACFSLICSGSIVKNKLHENKNPYTDSFLVPGIPHRVELKGYQSPLFGRDCNVAETQNTAQKSYPIRGMLVNNFEEMEPWYIGQYKVHYKAWGIGPVSLCHKGILNKIDRGEKASIDANHCLNWLDSMTPGSVIYACFGSMSCIQTSQLAEIGLGLESSNEPFIWVIRNTSHSAKIGRWLEVTKFEKRVEGRGLVIKGWAPQLIILSHPSIGGFLTHCGWNSTIEGICGGVPMITWPMFQEQFVNEKLVTDILGIGVSIFVEARLSSKDGFVKRERVKEAIVELRNGEKAGEMKRRARALGELANKAVEEGGSSHSNITELIQDVIMQLVEKEEQAKKISQEKV